MDSLVHFLSSRLPIIETITIMNTRVQNQVIIRLALGERRRDLTPRSSYLDLLNSILIKEIISSQMKRFKNLASISTFYCSSLQIISLSKSIKHSLKRIRLMMTNLISSKECK